MNRDFHTTPLQGGGRDSFDYGRTDITPDDTFVAWPLLIAIVVSAMVAGALVYGLIMALVSLSEKVA